jgi:hypothetical protein
MRSFEISRRCKVVLVRALAGFAVAAVVGVVALAPRPVEALPQYAKDTGLPCGRCHVSPAGGGKLSPFGQKFKDNGHRLK